MNCHIVKVSKATKNRDIPFQKLVFTGLGMLLLAQVPFSVFSQSSIHFEKAQEIESFIQKEIATTNMPGLAISIVKGDAIVYQKGFGVSQSDSSIPVTPQTPFFIGSVSKIITTLAVLPLVDQKIIKLDEPIRSYIPWFQVSDSEDSKHLTLRHLLTHTSGIPSSADFAIHAPTVEQRVRNLQGVRLISKPGETNHYAGPNYQVVAALIETVSGMPFEHYLKKNIFTPLEMKHSFLTLDEAQKHGLSAGHQYFFGAAHSVPHTFEASRLASGHMMSTVEVWLR